MPFQETLLLQLSTAIATVRDKQHLREIIQHSLREAGFSDDICLVVNNHEQQRLRLYLLTPNPKRLAQPNYNSITGVTYSPQEAFWLKLSNPGEPGLFDVDELMQQPAVPAYVRYFYNSDIRQVISITLRDRNREIGSLLIYNETKQEYTRRQLMVVQGIGDQIATAVANLLANESITQRLNETETLLTLSRDIAGISDRMQLLPLLRSQLEKMSFYTDIAISVINEDQATVSGLLIDWHKRRHQHPEYKQHSVAKHPVNDGILDTVLHAGGPVAFDLEEVMKWPKVPPYAAFMYKNGIRHFLYTALWHQNRTIGILHLCSPVKKEFNESQLRLLQGMSNQLGTAIANILVNEDIRRKEQEKAILLSISYDIARIREKKDLIDVINTRLKSLFNFNHCGIGLVDKEHQTYTAFLLDPNSPNYHEPALQRDLKKGFPVNDGIVNIALESEQALVLNIEELARNSQSPSYIHLNNAKGIREMVCMALRNEQGSFGLFFLFAQVTGSFTENNLGIIQAVGNQISIAVSNIRATEEVIEREQEKSLLLSIGKDISINMHRDRFISIVLQKLRNLFPLKEFVIAISPDNNQTHHGYLYHLTQESKEAMSQLQQTAPRFDFNDGVYNVVLASERPVVFDLDELCSNGNAPAYIHTFHKHGSKEVLAMALRINNKSIGGLFIHFEEKGTLSQKQINLFEGICHQISIGVSNIQANEEILRRESQQSFLLSIGQDITSCRSKTDLVKIAQQAMGRLFPLRELTICYIDEQTQTHNAYLLHLSDDTLHHKELPERAGESYSINDGIYNSVLTADQPVIFDLDELTAAGNAPRYISFFHSTGSRQAVALPLRMNNASMGTIFIYMAEKNAFSQANLHLALGIGAQISIAVNNFRGYDKIQSQLEEIKRYKTQLEEENQYLQEQIKTAYNHADVVGASKSIQEVFEAVSQVAPSDSTVLLMGETGTGKELVARAIHNASHRKDKLMVKVNCAALPYSLIESELFGHEKGSFTGATERRIGKFELANEGTLFLDEIGEMPPETQVKLLRALQEREIERIGGNTTIKVNVRIIAATNRNLQHEVDMGKFRGDLFYRLNVFPITLPPLRERKEDITLLTQHFIKRFAQKAGKKVKQVGAKPLQQMMQYSWPGNVRELEHLIERSVLMTTGNTITEIHLPLPDKRVPVSSMQQPQEMVIKSFADHERDFIISVLKKTNGKIRGTGGAAELLQLPATTLHSKIKKLGIKKAHM
ncbi:sigma-54-dependent Fis family transcriptional regulator [Deminuibacter soli]|uniref:GAF domain-containing protein n=1 Tax=Deminuibacter soli TaxID=2291815 RepID=A0A3E1NF88_9BACT|nr:sigma 54-interacting transcriptional regulator [Deminuibacter soli]RFM26471.1 GAF domain-containing protein [Deminuibacter soli]